MTGIPIYLAGCSDFSTNGLGLLLPTECTVEETANGMYELKLVHPIDDDMRWTLIGNGCIVKAAVPARESPIYEMSAFSGTEETTTTVTRGLYKVKTRGSRLRLRSKPNTSAKILNAYYPGTEVVKLADAGSSNGYSWYQVSVSSGGAVGYMAANYLEYVRDVTDTITTAQPVTRDAMSVQPARDQLFRIYSVDTDTEACTVTASAMHIFYDLAGNIVGEDYNPDSVSASTVAAHIFDAALNEHDFELHCGAISGTVTGEYGYMSIPEALLDPDEGVVPKANALLVRDNYDVFILPDQVRDMQVTVRRGKNLNGVTVTMDMSGVITRIIPVGRNKDGDPLYLDGVRYIDSPHINDYPIVYAKKIDYDVSVGDGDGQFATDAEARAELRRLVQADYDDGIDLPSYGMEVDFITLIDTEEYANYASLQSIHLFDTVSVIDELVRINAKVRMTAYKWDVLGEQYISATLGDIQSVEGTIYSYNIDSVSGSKLIPNSVTGAMLRDVSIGYAKITHAAIEQLAADALTAVSAHINQLVAGTIEADQLYADLAAIAVAEITTANIEKANIDWAGIATLSAQVAEIAKAQITQANINEANIDWAKIDTLNAVIASIAQANIAAADIDFAHIKDLAAGTAIITQGVGGKLFISRLAVTEANMVSLSVGELIIKGGDGGFYALGVDAEGNITTTMKQIGNSDVEDLSINAGEKLIEGSVTAATLNATDIFADSAIIRQLIAANLEVDTLWNREAWMSKINGLGGSLDLSANESIRMVVDSLSTEKSTVFRQEEQPVGAGNGDLWIQPSTGRTWQYSCGEESALRFALTDDGQLAYAYADGETAYPIVIDENGMLAIDADARLLVDPDDVSGVWLLVSDPADPAQALDTYSGVYINKDEIHLVSQKTTVAVPGANGEDDVARFDAEGVHAQIIEADEINSPSVVATQVAATYTPANAGELTAIAENLKNVCLTGNVTVDASALTGGTLTLRGVSGGYSLTISGGTINSAEMIGCTARIVFSGVTFATSGAAATVEASPNVLITGGALNAGTGVLATERSRVCVSSCGGVCDYAADSRGFAEVTFTGTVPGTDMPYGLAKFSDGGQIYAGARLIAKPSAEPEPEKPTVQTVTLTPTLTRTYNGSWRDGYWLWQGRYGTLGLNRGCMWFDTSAFAGKTVLSASLSLKRLSGAGSGVAVAIKICGTTATGASGTPAVGAQYASVSITQGARKSVDVTSAVQALANGSIRGLMLYDSSTSNLSSSNNWTACYAKLYGYDSSDRPVLTVTYQ